MKQYNLGFISDQDLFQHVKNTILQYASSIDLKKFNKNILDPIKLTFDSKIYGKSIEELINDEIMRQFDKSNNNKIGDFHQYIFKHIGKDREVPKTGYDIINQKKNIFVELKNKHNTMNSSSGPKTYMRMQSTILKNDKATCMLVEVIAKKSQNIARSCKVDDEKFINQNIRRVSIDKFYDLVTGDSQAFYKLCSILPSVIDDVLETKQELVSKNTVLKELKEISPDIMKSIFLLSFSRYEGFEQLR